jgi:hypothetical protein
MSYCCWISSRRSRGLARLCCRRSTRLRRRRWPHPAAADHCADAGAESCRQQRAAERLVVGLRRERRRLRVRMALAGLLVRSELANGLFGPGITETVGAITIGAQRQARSPRPLWLVSSPVVRLPTRLLAAVSIYPAPKRAGFTISQPTPRHDGHRLSSMRPSAPQSAHSCQSSGRVGFGQWPQTISTELSRAQRSPGRWWAPPHAEQYPIGRASVIP